MRDPRDVVVSYAKYKNIDYNLAIDHICSQNLLFIKELKKNNFPKVEITGSWKFNYTSWRDGISDIPKIIIKYEDLHLNTFDSFKKILSFIGDLNKIDINDSKIKETIGLCKMENMSKLEDLEGFHEKLKDEKKFFRKGQVDEWKSQLSIDQIKLIEKAFHNEMKDLKYL